MRFVRAVASKLRSFVFGVAWTAGAAALGWLPACAGPTPSHRGPAPALDAETARHKASRSLARSPVDAGASAWIEGNDRTTARRAFSAAASSSAEASLWLAWLARADLDDDGALQAARRAWRLAPDAPEGWLAAALLLRSLDERATEPEPSPDLPPPAEPQTTIGRALAARLEAARVDDVRGLAAGGWIPAWTIAGPVGPDDPIVFRQWTAGADPAPPVPGPVTREVFTSNGRATWSAGGRPGLYVATACFEAPATTELWARTSAEAELSVDGRVLEPNARGGWRAQLDLSPGVHRIRVRARVDPRDTLFAVIGDGRTTPCPPRTGRVIEARTREELPSSEDPAWPGRYFRAVAATLEPFASAVERERALAWVPERAPQSAALLVEWVEWADERAPWRERRAALEAAVRLDPTLGSARIALGNATWDDGGSEALGHFEAAAQLAPSSWRPRWLAHAWLAERGRHAAALRQLELTVERHPPPAVVDQARSFLVQSRRIERSPRLGDGPLEDGPEPAPKRPGWRRAEALAAAGELDAALEEAYPLARAEPSARRWATIARWELGRGLPRPAGAAAQRALELDPLLDDAGRTLLQAAAALGDFETVSDTLKRLRATGGADLQIEKLAASFATPDAGLEGEDSWIHRNLAFDPWPFLRPSPGRSAPRGVDPLEPWAGHSHVALLDRVIDHVRPDGSVASEQHQIVRVQTRAAVDHFGELAPPPNTVLLQLRTLEPDGVTLEADRHPGKADLSLPGLSPGDAVERRWLALEGPSTPQGGYIRRFFFRSTVPTARAELVVVVAPETDIEYRALNGAPEPYVRRESDRTIYIWQASLQPAVVEEPFAPPREEFMPHVVVWTGVDERRALETNLAGAREMLTSSWYVETKSRSLVSADAGPEARLSTLTSWLRDHVEAGPPRTPLETLLARSGSRTALLVAMARAVGLDAELVALRPGTSARVRSSHPAPAHFSRLAGRVQLGDAWRWWLLDDGFDVSGRLPAELRGGSLVAVADPRLLTRPIEDAWVEVAPQVSKLDAALAADGTLTGTLTWSVTEHRRAELAEFARRVPVHDRSDHLERALAAAWPGARFGEVRVVPESGRLETTVRWPDFARPTRSGVRVDDFFSTLPLASVFGDPEPVEFTSLSERQTPLLVRESREVLQVQLRLPPDLKIRQLPRSFRSMTPFGSFEQLCTPDADSGTLALSRGQWLPQIRVQPEDYAAFRHTLESVMRATSNELVLVRRDQPPESAPPAPDQ